MGLPTSEQVLIPLSHLEIKLKNNISGGSEG